MEDKKTQTNIDANSTEDIKPLYEDMFSHQAAESDTEGLQKAMSMQKQWREEAPSKHTIKFDPTGGK